MKTDKINTATSHSVLYSNQLSKVDRLFKAVAQKNLAAVKQLADLTTVNATNNKGLTPLALLIEQSEDCSANEFSMLVEIGQALIDAGAAVNFQHNRSLKTPLHVAAENDCIPLCDLLIKNGCEIEALDSFGSTPIIAAASFARTGAVIDYLARQHANVHAKTYSHFRGVAGGGMTALHFVFNENRINSIIALVENGADLDVVSDYGITVLECMDTRLFRTFELDQDLPKHFAEIVKCKWELYAAKSNSSGSYEHYHKIAGCENKLSQLLAQHDSAIQNAKTKVREKLAILIQEKNSNNCNFAFK